MAYSKVFQCSNPDSMLWKLHQKAKFTLSRHNDLFQNGKNNKNLNFMEIFSFLISIIFVELQSNLFKQPLL